MQYRICLQEVVRSVLLVFLVLWCTCLAPWGTIRRLLEVATSHRCSLGRSAEVQTTAILSLRYRKVQKVGLDVIVTSVDAAGTDDVVVGAGVLHDAYVLPTKKVDTPESAEKESKGPVVRTLAVDAMSMVRRLSNAQFAFYRDGMAGTDQNLAQIGVGSLIEVDRIHVNEVVSKGIKVSYLNNNKAVPLMGEAPGPGALAPHIIATLQRPELLRLGAFAASAPCKGFFNTAGLSEEQLVQARACQAMWAKVISSTADRLLFLAGGKEGATAEALAAHEARVRSITPEELASGEKNLFITHEKDASVVPWLNLGIEPWNKTPTLFRKLVGGGEAAAALPECFFVPKQIQATVTGNSVSVETRALFIFDKTSALEALAQGSKPPWLASPTAVLSFNTSTKELALRFGSTIKAKVDVAITQVLPLADFAAFVKVSQVEAGGTGLNSQWSAGGPWISMPDTLAKTGIRVSEAFVKLNLAEGSSQFLPDADSASERYELPANKTELPTFGLHRFQARAAPPTAPTTTSVRSLPLVAAACAGADHGVALRPGRFQVQRPQAARGQDDSVLRHLRWQRCRDRGEQGAGRRRRRGRGPRLGEGQGGWRGS